MSKKTATISIVLVILALGCISAQDIETETDIDIEDLSYDVYLELYLEKDENLQTVNSHIEMINRTTNLFCGTIASGSLEQEGNETQEELKPRDVNVEIYNQENQTIANCDIEENEN